MDIFVETSGHLQDEEVSYLLKLHTENTSRIEIYMEYQFRQKNCREVLMKHLLIYKVCMLLLMMMMIFFSWGEDDTHEEGGK